MRNRRAVALLLVLAIALVAGCATLNVKDPVAAGLFATKGEWTAIREYVIEENYYGRLSDADLGSFRAKDRAFETSYNVAKALRASVGPAFDKELGSLRDMLLDARRKYYPTGGAK